ncbi:MAG: c-type cytochrome [Gammaproteobacteria bacterium]|jgi:putative heme-binding domain-containing protein
MHKRIAAAAAVAAGIFSSGNPVLAQHATPFDIQDGERAFNDSCANCHGPDGNLIAGIDFGRGIYRSDLSDDAIMGIILNGIPDTPMPPTPTMSEEQARRIVAYLRAWAEEGRVEIEGNAERGRAVFFGEGGCDGCHAVAGMGARHGPDLSRIGRERRAAELQTALLDPARIVDPTGRTYRVTLAGGEVVSGRLLNHDTFTVQLIDTNDRLRSFVKADLRDYGFARTPMPAYGDTLSQEEITDLVSYLASLTGENE